jgi:hypothetical protein
LCLLLVNTRRPRGQSKIETHQVLGDRYWSFIVLPDQGQVLIEMAQAARHVVGKNEPADASFAGEFANLAWPRMQLARNFVRLLRYCVIHNQNVCALDEGGELRIVAVLITGERDAVTLRLDEEGQCGDRAMGYTD